MRTLSVTSQEELDQAVADGIDRIEIRSSRGVLIEVTARDSSTVTAFGSSTVRAYGSSTVRARESSTVTAYGSSTVTAFESSTVTAYGSSTVTACESSTVTACDSSTVTACDSSTVTACESSTVRAYGSSTVTACGSSTATAFDSSTVRAYGSSTVRAYGSSTVTAFGSSTVTAFGSSTVTAFDSSTVTARSGVAVHLHDGKVKVEGGVVIDHTTEWGMTPAQWCDYHGVRVASGIAYVYKAVDGEWTTDRGSDYSPGATPEAPDWRDDRECGHGLHFAPTPAQALSYHCGATKFVRVGVSLDTLRPIYGGAAKCKAPRVVVPCVEVDLDMREVALLGAAATVTR